MAGKRLTISICIPVVSGEFLGKCMDSVFGSSYSDFEVIVNDSSQNPKISDLLSQYDAKVIKKSTRSFESRLLTVSESSGDRIFLMDETRMITPQLPRKIASMQNRMIAIAEREIGDGLITRLTNMDKDATISTPPGATSPVSNKSLIPRVYDREIILAALDSITRKLPQEKMRNVVGLDLELIYYESWQRTNDLEFIRTREIEHFGDRGYASLFRKYYRYGKSQKMLRKTVYSDLADLGGRNRAGLKTRDRVVTIPIQILRGLPFLLGYIGGSD